MRLGPLAVPLLLTSACATGIASLPPMDPGPQQSAVYLYRQHAEPTSRTVDVLLDGKAIATLEEATFTRLLVASGRRTVRMAWPEDTQAGATLELKLEPGKRYFISVETSRVGGGLAGDVAVDGGTRFASRGGAGSAATIQSKVRSVNPLDGESTVKACCSYLPPLVGKR
ncbi:MAG: hypothetical protein QM767_04350 [Anaeromyxobacter sp.]